MNNIKETNKLMGCRKTVLIPMTQKRQNGFLMSSVVEYHCKNIVSNSLGMKKSVLFTFPTFKKEKSLISKKNLLEVFY
jgi:hypothetical protein